jgi:hypothetical protein
MRPGARQTEMVSRVGVLEFANVPGILSFVPGDL